MWRRLSRSLPSRAAAARARCGVVVGWWLLENTIIPSLNVTGVKITRLISRSLSSTTRPWWRGPGAWCCRRWIRTTTTTTTTTGGAFRYCMTPLVTRDTDVLTGGWTATTRGGARSWPATARWWRTPGRRWSRRGSSWSCSGGRWRGVLFYKTCNKPSRRFHNHTEGLY